LGLANSNAKTRTFKKTGKNNDETLMHPDSFVTMIRIGIKFVVWNKSIEAIKANNALPHQVSGLGHS